MDIAGVGIMGIASVGKYYRYSYSVGQCHVNENLGFVLIYLTLVLK